MLEAICVEGNFSCFKPTSSRSRRPMDRILRKKALRAGAGPPMIDASYLYPQEADQEKR
jgi:hypothetical protein